MAWIFISRKPLGAINEAVQFFFDKHEAVQFGDKHLMKHRPKL